MLELPDGSTIIASDGLGTFGVYKRDDERASNVYVSGNVYDTNAHWFPPPGWRDSQRLTWYQLKHRWDLHDKNLQKISTRFQPRYFPVTDFFAAETDPDFPLQIWEEEISEGKPQVFFRGSIVPNVNTSSEEHPVLFILPPWSRPIGRDRGIAAHTLYGIVVVRIKTTGEAIFPNRELYKKTDTYFSLDGSHYPIGVTIDE